MAIPVAGVKLAGVVAGVYNTVKKLFGGLFGSNRDFTFETVPYLKEIWEEDLSWEYFRRQREGNKSHYQDMLVTVLMYSAFSFHLNRRPTGTEYSAAYKDPAVFGVVNDIAEAVWLEFKNNTPKNADWRINDITHSAMVLETLKQIGQTDQGLLVFSAYVQSNEKAKVAEASQPTQATGNFLKDYGPLLIGGALVVVKLVKG